MRNINGLAGILLLFLSFQHGWAQHPALMSDPVFGIGYDPLKVHFEAAPSKISELCPQEKGEKFWIYAYWRNEETEYFVLSNRRSSTSGAGIIISDGQCVEALPDWVLTGNPEYGPELVRDRDSKGFGSSIRFTPDMLHGLAIDLLRRYTVAFGGKKEFLDSLRRDGLLPNDKMPILKEEFEKFSRLP